MPFTGLFEGFDDGLTVDWEMRGEADNESGVVIEPCQYLSAVCLNFWVGAAEEVVGDIGLPGFVRKLSSEPGVGTFGSFLWGRFDTAGLDQVAADR